jgi:uncharacterized protein with NAD-binding domain and iron-sulfur cluster
MKRRVLVIGGGPAGLSAALSLCRNGYAVTILEARRELGGRLVCAPNDEMSIQWGWHRATRAALQHLGTLATFAQLPPGQFSCLLPGQRPTKLHPSWLPGPLGLIFGLGGFMALPWMDRWRLLSEIERRWEHGAVLSTDLDTRTAWDWLLEMGQSEQALRTVWTPLTRFLIGQDAAITSASAFIDTVRRCFFSGRKGSRLSMSAANARTWFVEPARRELKRLGATLRCDSPVEQLRCDAQRLTTAYLLRGEALSADWYVAAVPARSLTALLPERAVTRFSYFQQLGQLQETPALIVQCQLDYRTIAPQVRLLSEGPFHWMLIRPTAREDTQVALVATQASELLRRDDAELQRLAIAELPLAVAALGVPIHQAKEWLISRKPDAFLSLRPGTAVLRPLQQSPFSNFLLAGDWTDTGLTPSLESAILSGERCAEAIMAKR